MKKATEKILKLYLQRDDLHDSDDYFVDQIIASESKNTAELCGGIIGSIGKTESYKVLNKTGDIQVNIIELVAEINHYLLTT